MAPTTKTPTAKTPTSFVARVRALIVNVLRQFGGAPRRRIDAVRSQVQMISELKSEIQEIRALHQRVAELTDLVAEVLVPLADRDDARVKDALARFQRTSF